MSDSPNFTQRVRTMQIIAFALVAGCLFFLGVILFQRFNGPQAARAAGELPMLTIMAGGMAVVCLVTRFVMPGVYFRGLIRAAERGADFDPASETTLLGLYQTNMIVCMALIEGPIFFAIVAYQAEGHIAALVLAIALIVILMLHFPTAGRVETWIKRQWERIELERATSRD